MTKAIPLVSKYMTPMPYTIDSQESLQKAAELMKEYKIRHLPVKKAGKISGLLSLQDINLLASYAAVDLHTTLAENAMTLHPYCVSPETGLDHVAIHMAEHRIGSALVVQENGTLVGIFTDTDALWALAEVFQTRLKK